MRSGSVLIPLELIPGGASAYRASYRPDQSTTVFITAFCQPALARCNKCARFMSTFANAMHAPTTWLVPHMVFFLKPQFVATELVVAHHLTHEHGFKCMDTANSTR
jgi:hypothetical protein